MTLAEFLQALTDLRERFIWYDDELGMLRAYLPGPEGQHHSAITALAEVRTGHFYNYTNAWEDAAHILGLTLHDASEIVGAEDQDRLHDPVLARALREAVGVKIS